jgi:ferric-dicitrate binding protein FerR (iron transport regulator)
MRFFRYVSWLLAVFLTTGTGIAQTPEPSPEPIGHVVSFTPAVFGGEHRIDVGAAVYANEVVHTGPSGVVELLFIDNTRLVLGPRSTVILDKFVYDRDGKAKAVVLKLTTGAFRFATGASPKSAYKVDTPNAAIGVRGTKFDVGLGQAISRVTIFEGAMRICPPHRPLKYCKIIAKPGETAVVENGRVSIVKDGVRFGDHCTGTSASKICDLFGPY